MISYFTTEDVNVKAQRIVEMASAATSDQTHSEQALQGSEADETDSNELSENGSNSNTFKNLLLANQRKQRHHGVLVSGHRGGQIGKSPENTMHAFELAAAEGLKSIELDVSTTNIFGYNQFAIPRAFHFKLLANFE